MSVNSGTIRDRLRAVPAAVARDILKHLCRMVRGGARAATAAAVAASLTIAAAAASLLGAAAVAAAEQGRICTSDILVGAVAWGADEFAQAIGRPADLELVFFSRSDWNQFVNSSGVARRDPKRRLAVNIGLVVNQASLCDAAKGAYQSYYDAIARNLASRGNGDALVIAGHEFNGYWFPWNIVNNPPECYREAYRQLVRSFKAASPRFQFVWPINAHHSDVSPERVIAAYPGDDVVDFVGFSAYDSKGPAGVDGAQGDARFDAMMNAKTGGAFIRDFARAHNKRVVANEFGLIKPGNVGHGRNAGGDSVRYIERMTDFLLQTNAYAFLYFNTDWEADGGISRLVHFPRATARFKELWGRDANTCR